VLNDRDAKFCAAFDNVLASEGIRALRLPPRSLNLNAFTERWVRRVKEECLSKLILFGESSLRRALTEFVALSFGTQPSGQGKLLLLKRLAVVSAVASDSAASFDITAGPLDYFVATSLRQWST
jgi:putative transposase